MNEEINKIAYSAMREQATVKESFIKGFCLGRRVGVKSLIKNAEWRYQPALNKEYFYWKGKKIATFCVEFDVENQ